MAWEGCMVIRQLDAKHNWDRAFIFANQLKVQLAVWTIIGPPVSQRAPSNGKRLNKVLLLPTTVDKWSQFTTNMFHGLKRRAKKNTNVPSQDPPPRHSYTKVFWREHQTCEFAMPIYNCEFAMPIYNLSYEANRCQKVSVIYLLQSTPEFAKNTYLKVNLVFLPNKKITELK